MVFAVKDWLKRRGKILNISAWLRLLLARFYEISNNSIKKGMQANIPTFSFSIILLLCQGYGT